MMKSLVIISLAGLCLAFADAGKTEDYKDDDVNSSLVLQRAQFALKLSIKESWRRCKGAEVVKVTKARHMNEYRWPWAGIRYEIDMNIRTSTGKEIPCKNNVWQPSDKDTINIAPRRLCDCNDIPADE